MMGNEGTTKCSKQIFFTTYLIFCCFFFPYITGQTFVLHAFLSTEPMTAGVVLSILALFNLLSGPLQLLSMVSTSVANARVSSRRLKPFLLAPEISRHPSPSMSSGRFTSSVMGDPISEHSVS